MENPEQLNEFEMKRELRAYKSPEIKNFWMGVFNRTGRTDLVRILSEEWDKNNCPANRKLYILKED